MRDKNVNTLDPRYNWAARDRTVWQNLRALYLKHRAENGLTQQKLAEYLQVNRSFVTQHLNQLSPVNTDHVLKYAEFFRVEPAAIDPNLGNVRRAVELPKGYKAPPDNAVLAMRNNKLVVLYKGEEYIITPV